VALAAKVKKVESLDKAAALTALGKALADHEDMDAFCRDARPIAKEVRHVRGKIAEQEAVKGLAAIKAKGVAAMMRSRLSGAEARLGELYWDMGEQAPGRERFAKELDAIAECGRRVEALLAERKELDAELEHSAEANRQLKQHAASLWKQGFGG
jgi:hypothetical protein